MVNHADHAGKTANSGESDSDEMAIWGPYFEIIYPEPTRPLTSWHHYRWLTFGSNVSRRLWRQRQELRLAYAEIHGQDPDGWPTRHPGVVLDEVKSIGRAACLGCHWIATEGVSMTESGWQQQAAELARRHQT